MRSNKKPIGLWLLDGVTLLFTSAALLMIFLFTPADASMGMVQKVFYFHIASGWAGMLALFVGTIAAILYLVKGKNQSDIISVSSIEVGLLFAIITVVSGMIWARPIWLTWWTWDPRLTTMAILIFLYAAYFILRAGIENPSVKRRIAAVYAVLGFLSVPLTFFSIRAYRSIHPVVIGNGETGSFLSTKMLPAFYLSLVAFSFLLFDLIWHRYRIATSNEKRGGS
jgi:heme exporter protein C